MLRCRYCYAPIELRDTPVGPYWASPDTPRPGYCPVGASHEPWSHPANPPDGGLPAGDELLFA